MARNKEQFMLGMLLGVGFAYLPKIMASATDSFITKTVNFVPDLVLKLFGDKTVPVFLTAGDPDLIVVLVSAILIGFVMAVVIKK